MLSFQKQVSLIKQMRLSKIKKKERKKKTWSLDNKGMSEVPKRNEAKSDISNGLNLKYGMEFHRPL